MAATSTTEAERFTPPWRETDAKKPVYLIRAGSLIERSQIEAELSGVYDAGRVYSFELRQAMKDGILHLLADDPEIDRVIELVDRDADARAEDGETPELPPEDERLLADISNILRQHWRAYGDLVAQIERRREIAPILAFQRFVVGWENLPVPFARDRQGRIPESSLIKLDPIEMKAVGNRAYALLYPELDAEKNSAAPSSSEDGPKISDSADTTATGGKSTGRSGRKTPA
ncbi:MAG: hypothetical protein BGN95_03805 [Sphingomonas sp. 66-10]|uniref:hypothetical protein n=1 Tax=Sphingomonas sp. 66-10 TaxID=1895848 RepID=UPI00092ABB23|nr:hypothetical protein [Sphingomonas sp. 66-10]OJU22702.1 MAG: hypothetical protein BGN95_03805 [Sphingomonas sp. 66-10]